MADEGEIRIISRPADSAGDWCEECWQWFPLHDLRAIAIDGGGRDEMYVCDKCYLGIVGPDRRTP